VGSDHIGVCCDFDFCGVLANVFDSVVYVDHAGERIEDGFLDVVGIAKAMQLVFVVHDNHDVDEQLPIVGIESWGCSGEFYLFPGDRGKPFTPSSQVSAFVFVPLAAHSLPCMRQVARMNADCLTHRGFRFCRFVSHAPGIQEVSRRHHGLLRQHRPSMSREGQNGRCNLRSHTDRPVPL